MKTSVPRVSSIQVPGMVCGPILGGSYARPTASPSAPNTAVPTTAAAPHSATRRTRPSPRGRAINAPRESRAVAEAQKSSVDSVSVSLCVA
ncbi:hypothetical protein [Streptomyces erythrochromogenes]|uniref:hypothetical protein n=1 Tax=Streptomyces erythrochromogenes TaxID=285574 RepID=UPI00343BAD34